MARGDLRANGNLHLRDINFVGIFESLLQLEIES